MTFVPGTLTLFPACPPFDRFTVMPFQAMILLQIFAHGTTAVLSCHVQKFVAIGLLYPRNEVRGVYWIHTVCLSVCLSVCPLTFHVRPVASTVLDGFFPYSAQMINSMRVCVACDDP